jgi:hypothetical protein
MAKETQNLVEEARQARKDAEVKVKAAIEHLLAKKDEIEKELAELGYQPAAAPKATGQKASSKQKPNLHCDLCGVDGHDGRLHKRHPEKFAEAELKALATKA